MTVLAEPPMVAVLMLPNIRTAAMGTAGNTGTITVIRGSATRIVARLSQEARR